ncbi:MAG: SpoIIE family protein phosphatase [Bacteroidales bacterium]
MLGREELTPEEKKNYKGGEGDVGKWQPYKRIHLLESIDADRMPIGISSRMNQPFTLNTLDFREGTTYYLLSDGYCDQFGGESGRKFLKKNLKRLILEIQGLSLKEQNLALEKSLLDWMGDHPQVDDILVIGVRVL